MMLRNRTVVITGASSGIGRELALLLARYECKLILTGRNRDRLLDVANAVSGTAIIADLSSPASVKALCHQVSTDHPDVSILINNAAVQLNGLFSGTNGDRWFDDIAFETQVDFIAPIQLCALLLPLLRRQSLRNGTPSAVVNVSTGLALAPKKTAAVYCAAKSGLRTFSKAFRFQAEAEKKQGGADIRVVDVILPLVDTDMTHGRGTGKISADAAASGIIDGLAAEKNEIFVGKAKLLRTLNRLAPALSGQMFRNS